MTGPPTRVRRSHDAAVDPLKPMWRGAAVFRVLTFAFVLGVQLTFSADYARPGLSWVLVGLIGVWTVVTVWAFSVADGRRVWLAVADVAVVTALMASTLLVQTPEQVADPTPTITTLWSANPVVTAAVLAGARVGTAVGALVAAISLLVNGHITTSLARDSVILLLLGAVLGVVADTARRSHAALAQALRAEAALVEREHLARAVHDSVLQVLAFVRREGATLGGPGAELARLAVTRRSPCARWWRHRRARAPTARWTCARCCRNRPTRWSRCQFLAPPCRCRLRSPRSWPRWRGRR